MVNYACAFSQSETKKYFEWLIILLKTGRLEQNLEFLKKFWNLQSNFPDLERVCKLEMKSEKIVKSRSFFPVFKSYQLSYVSYCIVVTVLLQYVMRKAWFLRFSRSLLITYLITLSVEKEIIVLGKKSGNDLKFWIQKQYDP